MKLETFLDRLSRGDLGDDVVGRVFAERLEAQHAAEGETDPILEAALHFVALQYDLEPTEFGGRPVFLIAGDDPGPWERLHPRLRWLLGGFSSLVDPDASASPPEKGAVWRVGPLTPDVVSAWPKAVAPLVVALVGARPWRENQSLIDALAPRALASTVLLVETREEDVGAATEALAVGAARLLPSPRTRFGRLLVVEGAFSKAAGSRDDVKAIPAMKPFASPSKDDAAGFRVCLLRSLPTVERLFDAPVDAPAAVLEARSAMTFRARRRPRLIAAGDAPEASHALLNPKFWVRPLTLTVVDRGRVNGAGFVLDREDGLLEDSFLPTITPDEYTAWSRLYRVSEKESDGHLGFIDKRFVIQTAAGWFQPRAAPPEAPRRVEGTVLAACGFYHQVYSHWLIDIMSKLWALPWLAAEGVTDFKVALPDPLSAKQRQMLRLLGVPEDRIVLLKREEWLVADRLLVPSRPARMYDFVAPEAMQLFDRLAERALSEEPVDVARLPRRIYAGRGGSGGRRELLNEAEVMSRIEAAGYAPVEFAELSVAEEIALYRNAEAIAAPHGSALGGIVFMRPGSEVCCFFTPELLRVMRHHFSITAHRDVGLTGVLGDSFDTRIDAGPWVVDADLVERALAPRSVCSMSLSSAHQQRINEQQMFPNARSIQMRSRAEIIAEARKQKWFNSISFDGFEAIGREGPEFMFPNISLYSAIELLNMVDVSGMRCAEIGPGSGLIAIGLKARGASYVAAIDGRHVARQCELAIELSDQNVDYLPIGIEGALQDSNWLNSFDLVFSAGLMYHLINPFMLIDVAKKLLKRRGIFVLQSMINGRNEKALLKSNTRINVNGDWTTFFVPTPEAMRSMCSLGLFERLAERHVKQAPTFHSIISRSVLSVDHLRDLSRFEHNVLQKYSKSPDYPYGGYSFRDYIRESEESKIRVGLDSEIGVSIDEIDLETMDAPEYPYMPRPRRAS